jgi:ABC-type nitrate/sulfonate/bicarbonate transport system permease component
MKTKAIHLFWPALLLFSIMAAWEAAVRYFRIPSYLLPGPLEIMKTAWLRSDLLLKHTMVTMAEIGLGFILALAVGVALAVAIQASRILERALLPLIVASQTIPVFAIAPLLVLWFGYGIGSKVVMTAIIVFFPITINMARGLRAVDPDTLALLTMLEAGRWQVFTKVRLPQSLPFLFTGIKIAVAVSVIGAVIGEWVGAREGLGYLMVQANAQLQVEMVFAAIFYLSAIGTGLYALAAVLERLLVPWAPTDYGQ